MRIPEEPPKGWLEALQSDSSGEALVQAVSMREVQELVREANENYLHWDKFRFRQMPKGVDAKVAWMAVDMSRHSQFINLPLSFLGDGKLRYWVPAQHHEWISLIDQKAGGYIVTRSARAIPDDDERYLYSSLMEEAIASSMLEGAVTTREVAKEMLRARRRPRGEAEQMILNNYRAILEIRDLKQEKLTPALLCHLQEILTEETLRNPEAAGRFRLPGEDVHVVDMLGEIIFTPPPSESVEARVAEICEFANSKSKPFVHPVIKAMALHFALGFIHPFVDGNGRTARAIFYWYMLKSGYWMFEYLPISRIIVHAPSRYAKAYLYTETDKGDLTYFNNYHLNVVVRAINELHAYLEGQQQQAAEAQELLEHFSDLNLRQRMLLQSALRHPTHGYTIKEHQGEYRTTYNTARSDLYKLEELGLLMRSKGSGRGSAKELVFRPAQDLSQRLGKLNKPAPKKKESRKSSAARPKDAEKPELFQKGLFD